MGALGGEGHALNRAARQRMRLPSGARPKKRGLPARSPAQPARRVTGTLGGRVTRAPAWRWHGETRRAAREPAPTISPPSFRPPPPFLSAGIPKFYRWLSERYPLINQPVLGTRVPEIDNLYLVSEKKMIAQIKSIGSTKKIKKTEVHN